MNGTLFEVIGVMPPRFRGLEILAAPDFWVPLSLIDLFRAGEQGRDASARLEMVGRLGPGVSRGQALAQLVAWDSQGADERAVERSAASLALEPRTGAIALSQRTGAALGFMPLFFAFGLVLVIGCANVANLLLARLVARQREIGIRLSIGASRRRVVWQLLIESLLLAFVSAAFAFGISRLVLAGVVYWVTSTFPPDIGNLRIAAPSADWRVALFLVVGAVVSTLFFALAPALQATRLDLARAMRGEVLRDGHAGRARNALVALQVTGSVLLLICTAVFLRSAWVAAAVDPGVRVADVVNVAILDEERRGTVLGAVNSEPSVATVAAVWPSVLGGAPAYAEGAAGKSIVRYQFALPEYFDVLGIDLVRGRGFNEIERGPDAAVAIVSESVARELWPDDEPIGQVVRVEPDLMPEASPASSRHARSPRSFRPSARDGSIR